MSDAIDAPLRLSVDEVALVLGHLGRQALARELLFAFEESPNADVGQGRLLAAGHSLLAKCLVDVDEDGHLTVHPALQALVAPLAQADFSLRASNSAAADGPVLAFHFTGGQVLRHRVERDLVHEVEQVSGPDPLAAVVLALERCFDIVAVAPFAAPESRIPDGVLAAAKAAPDEASARKLLEEAGVHELTRDIFLRDFRESLFEGSILRVDFSQGEDGRSDFGLMLFMGPERLWLLRIEPSPEAGEAAITIMPGDRDVFAREVRFLVDRGSPP